MNILTVFAHPSQRCFNRTLLETLQEVARAKDHQCLVRDLYGQGFNPSLTDADFETFSRGKIPDDIKAEQDLIKTADVVVFMHPLWWFGMPAVLKGWVDRVFTYGFAYGHDSRGVKPMLSGKKAIVVNTAGGQERESYDETGFRDAIIKLNDLGIYQFVGFDIILRRMFFEVSSASDERRRGMAEELRADLWKIF